MSISNDDIMAELKIIKEDVDDLKKIVNMSVGAYKVMLIFGKITTGMAITYAIVKTFYLSIIGG